MEDDAAVVQAEVQPEVQDVPGVQLEAQDVPGVQLEVGGISEVQLEVRGVQVELAVPPIRFRGLRSQITLVEEIR